MCSACISRYPSVCLTVPRSDCLSLGLHFLCRSVLDCLCMSLLILRKCERMCMPPLPMSRLSSVRLFVFRLCVTSVWPSLCPSRPRSVLNLPVITSDGPSVDPSRVCIDLNLYKNIYIYPYIYTYIHIYLYTYMHIYLYKMYYIYSYKSFTNTYIDIKKTLIYDINMQIQRFNEIFYLYLMINYMRLSCVIYRYEHIFMYI